MRPVLLALLALTTLPAVASAQPGCAAVVPNCESGERYYMLLFGGSGDIFRPRTSHTWATFVRTAPSVFGERPVAVDTISWLPATLKIRPFALREEVGANLTLVQTLDFLDRHPRTRIVVWGPYEITPDRYRQAMNQKALLESGAVKYHSLGLFGRRDDVMHCIDGVTRMDPDWELKSNPSRWYGEAGTAQVVRTGVRVGVILDPKATYPWLLPVVNPNGHKLTERSLGFRPLLGLVR